MADHRLSQISTASSNNSKRGKSYIGPWQLGKTLGSGSSGRVRLAKHSETGQLAAVKIVAKSQFSSSKESKHGRKPSESYGIEREVIIMKLIEHPNVMALYDVWENKGELYLVLEYVEGGELFDYLISRGKLSESEAIHYFRQICFGVDYCHKFNICHRDLKPENLLLDKNRNIKIADFGMAALESDERLLETSCGSPHYASPEIVTGQTYHGAPSDIWSCGIILFALLSGHLPFDDDNIRHLLMKVQSGRYKMPHSLSPEARDLISRMLVVDPKRRITMPEILRHPLLRKHPSSKIPKENLSKHNKLDVSQPILNIDRDILRNLQTLWHHDTKEMLISKLQSPDANVEKTFYALLLKFRKKHGITERNVIPRNKSVASMKSLNSSKSITSFASNKSISHQRSASVKSALSGRSNISLRSKRLTQRRQTRHSHRGGNHSRTNSQADKMVKSRNRDSLQTEAFADMLERAFNQTPKPNEVRAISNPNPVTNNNTVSPSLSAYSNQKRVISAPAPYTSTNYSANYGNYSPQTRSANPYNDSSFGTPPTSAGSAVSGSSGASTLNGSKESYLLPMIFEEDKFAMNLEEEINEKVEVIGYSSNQKKVAAPKREAPPKPSKSSAAPKSSALTGPPLINHNHNPTDSQPGSNNYTDLGLSTPVSPTPPTLPDFNEPQARSTSTLATANSKRNTQRKPVPIYIDESSDSSMEKPEVKEPTSPFERKPLQPIDTSNKQSGYEQLILPKTNRQVQKAQEMKTQPKEKERHNWIRRLTPSLTSRRTSKEIKDKEKTQVDKENANVISEEPHQNWVMKLFSSSQAPKVMYAPQPTFALRNTLLKTFADWSKFGLQVTETSKSKPFTITILPANSLRLKSAKIEVQLSRKTSVLSMVKLVFRKGSRQSYSTFSNEVERRLREMKIVL